MNVVGLIPDIPKVFTAVAEWSACVLYILVIGTTRTRRTIGVLAGGAAALVAIQLLIGVAPIQFWLLGMAAALAIMWAIIGQGARIPPVSALYWMLRAFLLAEFTASLEWQLAYFFQTRYGFPQGPLAHSATAAVIFSAVLMVARLLEKRGGDVAVAPTVKQLWTPAIIAAATFALSNLSYVSPTTPFTSTIATEAFNIRTLVQLGGVAFLQAYHIQLRNIRSEAEVQAFRNILSMQYAQYEQSKQSIEVINHKYHDLKHQLAVLRAEADPDIRDKYVADMERGIRDYEAQFKTGNPVLDTVLTGKALVCNRHSITLTCVADGELVEGLDVMDVCTIIGNALDNAIEALQLIDDPDRRLIHVSISRIPGFVVMRFENTLDWPVDLSSGLPRTTKTDTDRHGFGLRSIRRIAEGYGGAMTVKADDGVFELTILLPEAV